MNSIEVLESLEKLRRSTQLHWPPSALDGQLVVVSCSHGALSRLLHWISSRVYVTDEPNSDDSEWPEGDRESYEEDLWEQEYADKLYADEVDHNLDT
ncbi:hypothetical protein BU24DRAFT_466927 [Aaosphaeria arxii CBS 175.79]|uniref:Uncharacterized protein n=1 Tax=Aaosphaeria arxii CBS 175.79 TaxID=1450172 RepID=A0A6A5XE74_9PLEO|nr:uncharacterized protein BU24DRAFT_466927 [Aaosphaeria arxii CBS 175.79]KAF2011200.1 hypothetical protein BU24DRAFT_466927 [Aaosphaeria arxii CBS 175.79]